MDWKPLLKTFASILFGFALGVLSKFGGPPGPPHFGRAPIGGSRFAEQFAKDFDLSAEQKALTDKIFSEQREKAEQLHKEVFPKFDAIRSETRTRVRAVLNESQQAKFDKVHDAMESLRHELHHGGPGGGLGDDDGPPPPPFGGGRHEEPPM